ncbi:putative glycoside hydrolase family 3 protein [Neofusicoccum parvum UCRNP2]|uniref:xylan 1,4-beta-xylosidase n=1 Tax=Botryosphaeria parva (strain UCR-NP2) TaxID=1287680 RepID=R1EPK1_BOTPV|nr:putative glycoside hydrolase family 3 protein [Neofusicoccum parvum UCRNP2]
MTLEEKLNNTGNTMPGVPRLGVPPYQWWNDALHGMYLTFPIGPFDTTTPNSSYASATQFPQAILLGAAFDDELVREVGSAIAGEMRAFSNAGLAGVNNFAPTVNPFRDPRWGRGMESPGEDPVQVARYARAMVEGLQGEGEGPYRKTIATCKHYAGYDVEDWGGNDRYAYDARISPQDLSEYYTPPFRACAAATAGSIMCSYNAVNGVPACASPHLLTTLLRAHWNSTALAIADCGATQNIYRPHAFTPTRAGAAAAALNAGLDLDCGSYSRLHLPAALSQNLTAPATLSTALTRAFAALITAGLFDPPAAQPYRALGPAAVNAPATQALARRSAAAGIVLLKNSGALPLRARRGGTVAVVGDGADATAELLGSILGKTAPAGRLPVTQYPAEYVHQVPMTDMSLRPSASSPGRTYKWYTGTPVYPFGYGLHYTTFDVSIAAKSSSQNSTGNTPFSIPALISACPTDTLACPITTLTITATNTGNVTSDYVALLFLTTTAGPAPHPNKSLINHHRFHSLAPGDTQTADIALTIGDLVRVGVEGDRVLWAGAYSVRVGIEEEGFGSVGLGLVGEEVVVEEWPREPEVAEEVVGRDVFGGSFGV